MASLSTENGCNWEDLPKDLPPYSTGTMQNSGEKLPLND